MKKRNKSILSIALALVMVFSMFGATAFAVEAAQVGLEVYVNGTGVNSTTAVGATAEDAVQDVYPDQITSDWSGSWLKSITIGGIVYASEPYTSDLMYFDDIFYQGGDPVLDAITDHGGVSMDASEFLGAGYYFMDDGYCLYLGSDWMFKIDYVGDGLGYPVIPGEARPGWPDDFYQYTMGEADLTDGDIIYLYYDWVPTFFEL
jgi:hypothetical protein